MKKYFFSLIMPLLFVETTFAVNFFRCEKTEECVMAYTGCGRYLSVHRRYKELYEAKARKGDTTSFCIAPAEKDKELRLKGVAECRVTVGKKKKLKNCRLYIPKE